MSVVRLLLLHLVVSGVGGFSALGCGSSDGDADGGVDGDSDVDGDARADSDTDGVGDGGSGPDADHVRDAGDSSPDSGPSCGNGSCEAGESCSGCEEDCGCPEKEMARKMWLWVMATPLVSVFFILPGRTGR